MRQNETYAKLLDRNGKKDLVSDGLSRLLNRNIGVKFEIEPAEVASNESEPQATVPGPGDSTPVRDVVPTRDAPASEPTATPVRLTAEIVAAIREQTPLVKALMDGLGATVVKVE